MSDPQNLFPQSFKTSNQRQLRFLDKCSRCGLRPATTTHKVDKTIEDTYTTTKSDGFWSTTTQTQTTSTVRSWGTEVPICEQCIEEIKIAEEKKSKPTKWIPILLLISIVLGIILAIVIIPPDQRAEQFWGIIVVGIAFGFTIWLILMFSTLKVMDIIDKDNIKFVKFDNYGALHFSNKEYDSEFKKLNGLT